MKVQNKRDSLKIKEQFVSLSIMADPDVGSKSAVATKQFNPLKIKKMQQKALFDNQIRQS